MVDTIYSAMEFYGKGDPYFSVTAADWALYKTEDGGHAFISAADAQRRNFGHGLLSDRSRGREGRSRSEHPEGLDFCRSHQTPTRSPDRTDFVDCRQQACR
ncbi:hypothetical protein GOC33_31500 [Sinorhizobium meliloti]|nr:hypothetical protein [Sinorhizobium meliloti]